MRQRRTKLLHVIVVTAALAGAVVPGVAWAMGPCEDIPLVYGAVRGFSPTSNAFAVDVTRSWCDVSDGGEEKTGELKFVELRSTANKVVGRLASLKGADARRLRELVGKFETVPADQIAATLASRGYTNLVESSEGAKGSCTVKMGWTPGKKKHREYQSAIVRAEVMAGEVRVATIDGGKASVIRQSGVVMRAQFLPAEGKVAVYFGLPECDSGGPPPGYFGKDDEGTCYRTDKPVVVTRDVKAIPDLAGCFPATPAPPPAPAPAK